MTPTPPLPTSRAPAAALALALGEAVGESPDGQRLAGVAIPSLEPPRRAVLPPPRKNETCRRNSAGGRGKMAKATPNLSLLWNRFLTLYLNPFSGRLGSLETPVRLQPPPERCHVPRQPLSPRLPPQSSRPPSPSPIYCPSGRPRRLAPSRGKAASSCGCRRGAAALPGPFTPGAGAIPTPWRGAAGEAQGRTGAGGWVKNEEGGKKRKGKQPPLK